MIIKALGVTIFSSVLLTACTEQPQADHKQQGAAAGGIEDGQLLKTSERGKGHRPRRQVRNNVSKQRDL